MSGRNTSNVMPMTNARMPVSTNRNGRPTDCAFWPQGCEDLNGVFIECVLSGVADVRQKTTIGLLLALGDEAALFELRVKMHRPTVRAREQTCAGRQRGE